MTNYQMGFDCKPETSGGGKQEDPARLPGTYTMQLAIPGVFVHRLSFCLCSFPDHQITQETVPLLGRFLSYI